MYLRTDDELETINAVKMAGQFAASITADTHMWRWTVIALHNAAQGAMVLSLRHGNGLMALTEKSAAAWKAAYEARKPPPPDRLDSYPGLYKKVKSVEYGNLNGNLRFVPEGTEDQDIKDLNGLRNEFIHFTPKGWSLGYAGLPRIGLSVARLISFLTLDSTNVLWHRVGARDQMAELHSELVRELGDLDKSYRQAAS